MKKLLSVVLCVVLITIAIHTKTDKLNANATTSLPNGIYIAQSTNYTCTLASATMMIRARAYLSGYNAWNSITESTVKPVAWGSSLKWSFTYTATGISIEVGHTSVSGIKISSLKALLDSHPEGIVLFCKSNDNTHAVLVTDYEGDVFYCADPVQSYSGKRITIASSWLGKMCGSQSSILSSATAYWYVSDYDITGNPIILNPWIKASSSAIFLGNNISFDFGADNATSYTLTVKHLNQTVLTKDNAKSGTSYNFTEEGTYTAYITAKNGNDSVDSVTVSFYIVDALDCGAFFTTKLKNPVSGYYVAADNTNNVYLASRSANANNEWKFIRQEDLSYKVVNIKNGNCLGVYNGGTANGTNIGCYPSDDSDSQRWYIRKNISGYALVPKIKLSSDLSITGNNSIYGECIFDGANISLYENDSVQSQRFDFEYIIPPVNTNVSIDKEILTSEEKLKFNFDVDYAKSYTLHAELAGVNSIEMPITPGQSVSFEDSGRWSAYIICTFEDGTQINTNTVYFYNMKIYNFGNSFTAKIQNTTSEFFIATNVTGTDQYNAIVASEGKCDNNLWQFDRQTDGSYKITNIQTNLVLSLNDGQVEDNTNIICSNDEDSDTQKWFITKNIDGYAFAPKMDYTKYISVFENDTIWWYGEHIDGANVLLYDLDNVQSQRFELVNYNLTSHSSGDIDNSGDVTLDDVVALAQVVAGWQNVVHNAAALDINGDADTTLDDVVLLAQFVAGWSVELK